jgi:hypothetical protein
MAKFALFPSEALFGVVAAATEFLRGLYEQNLWLRCVVDRVARQAAEMSPNVRLADFCFVTAPATGQNHFRLDSAVVFDEFGIACIRVLGAGSVATFATTRRRILALQRLGVSRLGEGLVDVFMTSLTDVRPDVFRVLIGRGWGVLRKYPPAHNRNAQKGEPAQGAKCHREFHMGH